MKNIFLNGLNDATPAELSTSHISLCIIMMLLRSRDWVLWFDGREN